MDLLFNISLVVFFLIIIFILYNIIIEIGTENWGKFHTAILSMLGDYSIFGQGVGASVSGFTIVELIKDKTSVSTHELFFVFLSGIGIFEISRRLYNRLKSNL